MKTLARFRNLKNQYPETIIIFRMEKWCMTVEEDAETVANDLGIIVTKHNNVKVAGFPLHALDEYLPRLIRKGHKISIVDPQ